MMDQHLSTATWLRLEELLEANDSHFHWNAIKGVWCISGTTDGRGWETDDYKAESRQQAAEAAITYLEQYGEQGF